MLTAAQQEFLRRLEVRKSFLEWCRVANPGFEPAAHHRIIIKALEDLVENLFRALVRGSEVPNEPLRLMVMTPPGSAKSTYISKLFPPWFLAQMSRLETMLVQADKPIVPLGILACSHSSDYADKWGKVARDTVVGNERWLGTGLCKDSRASAEWKLTNKCYYQAAGVGKGISGARMHLGVVDDFCGTEQDAGSKLFNDSIWLWWENDFVNRLQPIAARVIIANHRNEDDLCGRLMAKEASKWRIIRLRLLIETEEQAAEDPLGRKVGDYLWPEYFTRAQVDERMANPRASGIQQQEPSPEKGGFFDIDWFKNNEYDNTDLPPLDECHFYCASDHAVSTKQTADLSCFLPGAFARGKLWILPDVVWKILGSKDAVEAMLALAKRRKPLYWWAERGHISKSIGPFLQDRMIEERCHVPIIEVTPVKDKMTRAQSLHGMMSMGLVMWPRQAAWYQRARHEMLLFPNGKHDDFVDAAALLAFGINHMTGAKPSATRVIKPINSPFSLTLKELKEQTSRRERLRVSELSGF